MNDVSNFYDELDLKYPEIGIAMDPINRVNPGVVRFIIPVLTPNMDNSKIVTSTIYQNSSNLKNSNKQSFEISNLTVTNYIEIPIPREICGIPKAPEDILIPKESKWIIVFVGGDITRPRAIARYLD